MLANKACSGLVFGCIRQVSEIHGMTAGWSEQFVGSVMTPDGFICDSEFMAPETIRAIQGCPYPNEPAVSPAADIFSLGALLKTLLLVGPPLKTYPGVCCLCSLDAKLAVNLLVEFGNSCSGSKGDVGCCTSTDLYWHLHYTCAIQHQASAHTRHL